VDLDRGAAGLDAGRSIDARVGYSECNAAWLSATSAASSEQMTPNASFIPRFGTEGSEGSNPLAPTKFIVKPAEMQAFLLGSLRRLAWWSTRLHPRKQLLRIAHGAAIYAAAFENSPGCICRSPITLILDSKPLGYWEAETASATGRWGVSFSARC
jgi:hypothetical protein